MQKRRHLIVGSTPTFPTSPCRKIYKMATLKIKIRKEEYYALFCDCSKWGDKDLLLCAVLPTKKEILEVAKEIKDCPAVHKIGKVSVTVSQKRKTLQTLVARRVRGRRGGGRY